MIRLTLEMSNEIYEQLRNGIGIGIFKFSLNDLSKYNIRIGSVQHYSGDECND